MTEIEQRPKQSPGRLDRVVAAVAKQWLALGALLSVAFAVGVVLAVVHSPSITLQYVGEMRWPLAAVVLAVLFRRPISAFFDRIEKLTVPTPIGPGHIESGRGARPGDRATDRPTLDVLDEDTEDEDAPADAQPVAAVEAAAGASGDDIDDVRAELARWQEFAMTVQNQLTEAQQNAELLDALNRAFEAQLAFVAYLDSAPNGLTAEAVVQWFTAYKANNAQWEPFDLPALTGFLVHERLIETAPNGNYVVTDRGRRLVNAARTGLYAQKAY